MWIRCQQLCQYLYQLNRIYDDIDSELDKAEEQSAIKQDIDRILESHQSNIDLAEIFPQELANPLKQLAGWMNLRPETYLMSLLATVSSLHNNQTELLACPTTNYRIPPNLFVAIVAESSQKKSPIFKAIASQPLGLLERDERERFEQEMQAWKEECKQIQSEDKNAELPPEPQRRVHYVTRLTQESILQQAGRQQNGLLYLADELKAVFGSQNACRRGRGSDEEDMLELYDGIGGKVLRVNGLRDDVEKFLFAIQGGIQPPVLEKLVGNSGDGNGKWSRFFFVKQPNAASTLPIDGGSVDLTELLAGLYRSVKSSPAMEYRFSPAALLRFKPAYDRLEQMRVKEPNQSMRSVIGKTAGRIGKLALNLHVINWAMGDRSVPISHEIGLPVVLAAIKLAHFAIQQIKSLYSQFDDDSLAPHLVKVLEVAKQREDWIKARDVQQAFTKSQRPKAEQARQWFAALAEMGFGTVQGKGRSLQFKYEETDQPSPTEPSTNGQFVDNVDFVDSVCTQSSTAEALAMQEVQPFVDFVDDFENNLTVASADTIPAPVVDSDKEQFVDDMNNVDNFVDESSTVEALAPQAVEPFVDVVGDFDKVDDSSETAEKQFVSEPRRIIQPKAAPTRSHKRWYGTTTKDNRLPLIEQAKELAKSISPEQLDQLIADIYGKAIAIEKLGESCLELLVAQLKPIALRG